ncbi:hypothetical protein RJ035_005214 [Blastomyces gilchristii]
MADDAVILARFTQQIAGQKNEPALRTNRGLMLDNAASWIDDSPIVAQHPIFGYAADRIRMGMNWESCPVGARHWPATPAHRRYWLIKTRKLVSSQHPAPATSLAACRRHYHHDSS